MADTPEFRRHALLPKPQEPRRPWNDWPPLSDADLLRQIVDNADRLGSGYPAPPASR